MRSFADTKFHKPNACLEKNVTLHGMTIAYNPPGDGNCFFNSVLHQLQMLDMDNCRELCHRELRHRLAQFLTDLVSLTTEFCTDNCLNLQLNL